MKLLHSFILRWQLERSLSERRRLRQAGWVRRKR